MTLSWCLTSNRFGGEWVSLPPLPTRRFDILLVEDNEADVALTTAAFRDALVDAQVHVARDGEEAMSLLQTGEHGFRPDLVVLDLGLPKGMVLKCWR